ncbi:MAG: ATP-binding cassette domain-containing protein [Crocinitomicaceae bacterium]|nr:ATP-binding cassette domain-containing protein [Crocinitomicaceae bacterium]
MNKTVLEVQNLSKNYNNIKAVSELSLHVDEKMVYGILGPNGSGKTTTLGMLLGVINSNQGTYSWFDNGSKDENRKRIGSLLETPNFYPYLSAEQNLEITAKIKEVDDVSNEIQRVLKMVDLYDRRESEFKTFSLGMKQRLAIASALLGGPEVLVLDEPTNGLDPQGIAEIRDLIIDIGNKGKTIIIASHILDEIEKVCTHCAILKNGKLLRTGTIEEIIGNQESTLVKIGAEDKILLEKIISSNPEMNIYKQSEESDLMIISVSKNTKADKINQYFFDKGIVLNQLVVYNESLENQFLDIIKEA